jgi:hypothetical protein
MDPLTAGLTLANTILLLIHDFYDDIPQADRSALWSAIVKPLIDEGAPHAQKALAAKAA